MTAILISECLALLLLLFCSGFFSSAETALFSLSALQVHRLRKTHQSAADRIEKLRATPTDLLSAILVGNTMVNVAASALGYAVASHFASGRGALYAIPCMTVALLVFGELGPKRLAMSHAVKLASAYSLVLPGLIRVTWPLRVVMERVAKLFEKNLRPVSRTLTEDEFLTVVQVGEEAGVLDSEERTMVDGIIRLEDILASEVMTPRVDLVGIDLDAPPEESERIARSVRFRYLPVYRDSLDHPEGFLDVPRFLLAEKPDLATATVPPFAVPETAPLDALLATFQREHRRVAFVMDEFGGTAGLITRGDVLEEIAADVDGEYGEERLTVQKVGHRSWLVDGSTSLEDINQELETGLEAEGADRIAGWVSAQAERIPRTGEVVEAQGCRVTVQRVRKHRIMLVLLERIEEPVTLDEEEDEA